MARVVTAPLVPDKHGVESALDETPDGSGLAVEATQAAMKIRRERNAQTLTAAREIFARLEKKS
jgi:hypothetical protein